MTPTQIKWQRVVQHGTKKYGYVLVDNKNRPIQFDSDSGYFKVYDSPNTQSHYYSTYLLPKNKLSNNTVNDNNPVQLKEVQITAKSLLNLQVFRELQMIIRQHQHEIELQMLK